MASENDIQARLILLWGDVSGVALADDELPACMDLLPMCFVTEGGATYTRVNADEMTTTREWLCLLYVASFKQGDITGEKTAIDACRPFKNSAPKFFLSRQRLQRSDSGVVGVTGLSIRDDGTVTLSHKDALYKGIPFTVSITYSEDLSIV